MFSMKMAVHMFILTLFSMTMDVYMFSLTMFSIMQPQEVDGNNQQANNQQQSATVIGNIVHMQRLETNTIATQWQQPLYEE